MSTNKNKYFTLEERRIILGVTNGSTKVAIAKTLGVELIEGSAVSSFSNV